MVASGSSSRSKSSNDDDDDNNNGKKKSSGATNKKTRNNTAALTMVMMKSKSQPHSNPRGLVRQGALQSPSVHCMDGIWQQYSWQSFALLTGVNNGQPYPAPS